MPKEEHLVRVAVPMSPDARAELEKTVEYLGLSSVAEFMRLAVNDYLDSRDLLSIDFGVRRWRKR